MADDGMTAIDRLILERHLTTGSLCAPEYDPDDVDIALDEIERLRAAMQYACDLLAERKRGHSARSPGHNARLHLQGALKSVTSGQRGE